MGRKRTADEKRTHLLKKLKKLEEKIKNQELDQAISNTESPPIHHHDDNNDENNLENLEVLEEPMEEILEPPIEVEEIDESILEILGEAPAIQKQGQSLHTQLADRWLEVLKNGLKKDEKDSLTKDNPAFTNCGLMIPPKLNPEVSAALAETAKRRDQLIEKRQQQISTALSCLGSALQICVKEDVQLQKLKIIKYLNDASRLLCDSVFLDTKGRRSLILSAINRDMKEYLTETEAKEYLFGESLGDKIKTAKNVQRTGSDLKRTDIIKKIPNSNQTNPATRKAASHKTLNWRGPPRQYLKRNNAGVGGPSYSGYRRYQNQNYQKKHEEKPYHQQTRK